MCQHVANVPKVSGLGGSRLSRKRDSWIPNPWCSRCGHGTILAVTFKGLVCVKRASAYWVYAHMMTNGCGGLKHRENAAYFRTGRKHHTIEQTLCIRTPNRENFVELCYGLVGVVLGLASADHLQLY